MKKLLILIWLTPTLTFAQIWSVGGKAGVTFSNYKSETPWKEATNIGYSFGLSAFKQMSNNFGIGFELQYIQKGYYHKICNTITDELNANYLEVPVVADYTFLIPGLKNFKAHANIGFYTAYWMSASYKMKGFDNSSEQFDFEKNNAKRFDIGPAAGGRIEYVLKNGSFSLDLRYELGLMDMQKNGNDNVNNLNRAMIIGVIYMKTLGI